MSGCVTLHHCSSSSPLPSSVVVSIQPAAPLGPSSLMHSQTSNSIGLWSHCCWSCQDPVLPLLAMLQLALWSQSGLLFWGGYQRLSFDSHNWSSCTRFSSCAFEVTFQFWHVAPLHSTRLCDGPGLCLPDCSIENFGCWWALQCLYWYSYCSRILWWNQAWSLNLEVHSDSASTTQTSTHQSAR